MNKIKFDAKLLDLFSEDFDYLQSSIETEIYKIFKQITTYNGFAAIVKGFTLGVSTTDPTKLMITHSGPFGSIVSKDGIICESNGTIDNIPLADTALNKINVVYAAIESTDGSYNRATKTFVPMQKKAIDLADYSLQYDRVQDSWTIEVLTPEDYEALSQDEKDKRVYLGMIAASGNNAPLINPVNLNNRNIIQTHIQPYSITGDMISPTGFSLPQNLVGKSLVVSDTYPKIPTLYVTSVSSGSIADGAVISGSNITVGTTIVDQLTGTPGGIGTYSISSPQNIASIGSPIPISTNACTFFGCTISNVPGTTQDDFNKIRTHIKEMKGTLKWDDESPTTLFDFDRSINAIHENGVFKHQDGELQVVSHAGNYSLEVLPGLANVNGGISRILATSTGKVITLSTPVLTPVGGDKLSTNGEVRGNFLTGEYDYKFYIFNHDVTPQEITPDTVTYNLYAGQGLPRFTDVSYILITDTNNGPANIGLQPGFIQGRDYTVDADTGLVTITSALMRDCFDGRMQGGGGTSLTDDKLFKCYYKYGNARYDAVTMATDNEIQIFTGTPGVVPEIPVTSSSVVNLAYVYVKPFDTTILPENILDTRYYIDKVREIVDIPVLSYNTTPRSVERINYSSDKGVFTGYITDTTLTVSSMTSGTIHVGAYISGTGIATGTKIAAFLSGLGGVGTYSINTSQSVTSTTINSSGVVQTTVTSTGNHIWRSSTNLTGDHYVYTTKKGAFLETVVYAKENDEIWLIADKTPWVNAVTVEYTEPNSNVYNAPIPVNLFFNTRLEAYPIFVVNRLKEGYIKLRITMDNVSDASFILYNIIVGKLDLYYNKHSLSDIDYIVPQKITNITGMNAKASLAPRISNIDNVRKGRVFIPNNPNTKEVCGFDGRQLNYFDVEQKYPVSRVSNYCMSTGYTTSTGFYADATNNSPQPVPLVTFTEGSTSDATVSFKVPFNLIGAANHQRVAFYVEATGSGYSFVTLLLHDSSHNLLGSATVNAVFASTGYQYFELQATLIPGEVYHYHMYTSNIIAGTAPSIRSKRMNVTGDKKLYFVQFYKPIAGQYKSTHVLNFIKSDGTTLITERTDGTDAAGNRYDLDTLDIMAADLSNDDIWESWEYDPGLDLLGGLTAKYIGVDIKTGRIKMPVGYDIRDYFVEFNVKELGTKTDAKSYLVHGGTSTIEDTIQNIKQGSDFTSNAIINGSFDVWQRVRKGSTDWTFTGIANNEYSADMMRTYVSGANSPVVNIKRSSGDNSPYALQVVLDTQNTGTSEVGFEYRMPSVDAIKFRNKKVTVSFDVKKGASLSSDVSLKLYTDITTADAFGSLVLLGSAFTVTNVNVSGTSFRRFSNTFDLSTMVSPSSLNNVVIRITTSITSGVNLFTDATRCFEIQNLQLNEGAVSLPFQKTSFNSELQKCLPFYEKTYNYEIVPGTVTNNGSVLFNTAGALGTVAGQLYLGLSGFEKRKYKTPTVSLFNEAGAADSISNRSGFARTVCTVTTDISTARFSRVEVSSTTNAIVSGNLLAYHYIAKVEL